MSEIWTPGQELIVPDFNNYSRWPRPRQYMTGIQPMNYGSLDTTRLAVTGLIANENVNSGETILNSEAEKKVKIDGENHCVLRYEKNGFHRPVNVLGFDENCGEVIIKQIQWTKDRVSCKVHSLLDVWRFYADLLEENFFKNGVPVSMQKYWQDHITAADFEHQAFVKYKDFSNKMDALKIKYKL